MELWQGVFGDRVLAEENMWSTGDGRCGMRLEETAPDKLRELYSSPKYHQDDKSNEDEMGGECSRHRGHDHSEGLGADWRIISK
jgi:hypothetical protein